MALRPIYKLEQTDSGNGMQVNVSGRIWGFIYPDNLASVERWSAYPNYAQGGRQFSNINEAARYVLDYYPASPAEIRRLGLA